MESFLLDPFRDESVRYALVAAVLIGVLCGVVGSYVVLRGNALMADSLAHGILPGIAIAFMLTASGGGSGGVDPNGIEITLGALGAGLVTAAATAVILRRSRLRQETAAAVVFVFMLSLGVALISRIEGYSIDLEHFLFGDVLATNAGDIWLTAALTVVVLGAVAILYRPFLLVSFDPQRAAAAGLPVGRIELAMLVLITVAVVLGFRVVGSLLVLGLLLAPPATAALLTHRLPAMMATSAAIAAASAPIGLLASWHLDLAAPATIVLVAVSSFPVVLALRPAGR